MLSTRRFAAMLAIGAAVAVPIAGCGGDDDNDDNDSGGGGQATQAATTGGGGGAAGGTVDLTATDFKFDPSDPSVKSGEVTFNVTNDGGTTHALEVEGPGEESETDDISPGGSTELTVDLSKPGTYEFYCPVGNHKEMGMEGEITVK